MPTRTAPQKLQALLSEIRACRACEKHLPLGPRPVLIASPHSRIRMISQAPGTKVHASGIPFDDKSGDRLREWLQLDKKTFYDSSKISITPMGFCYPGRGKSGDLPPRKECAELWHQPLTEQLKSVKLTILVGNYAQKYYLGGRMKENMTETVRAWKDYLPEFFPIVHPSPRNQIWLAKNPWFERDVVPELKKLVSTLFDKFE